MSRYYKQMQNGESDAARGLRERLTRKEIGDATYEKSVSYSDDRAFKILGFVFITLFAGVVLAVAWLGY